MADNGEEIIGGVGVSITGDYSSLAASYSTAQDQAQKAGADIADAFNSGVAGVKDGAQVVSDSLSEMAEKFAAVGEALAITEGLREFGSEALNASDAITTASIALTKLTGDADQTKTTLEGLESLGQSDGLSMPSLLTASTRMTAMLPPGTDVVGLLGHIADGAAVMGTSIGQAATRFDQMADSGTTSARSLQSLGLSLPALAASLNQVANTTVATSSNVAAMFKAMDDQGRIAVLTTALDALEGTAQQAANATFGGQWQQLANSWEAIMAQVGAALTPVLADFASFVKLDILPFVQEMATDFNELPGPIRDTIVALGLVAAAAVPVTGAIGAFGLALSGLSTLGTAVKGVLETVGISFGATAEEGTAAAAAVVEVGAEATAAAPEIAAVALATEGAGAAATESAVQMDLFSHSVITSEWSEGAQQLDLFAEAEVGAGVSATEMGAGMALAATGGVLILAGAFGSLLGAYLAWKNSSAQQAKANQDLLDSVDQLEVALTKHGVQFQQLNDDYNNGTISLQSLYEKLQQLDGEFQNSVSHLQNASNNTVLLAGALQKLTEGTDSQNQAYTNAVAVYGAVNQALTTGLPLYKQHAANTADLISAEEALVSAAGKVPSALGSSTIALVQDQLAAQKAELQYQAAAGAYQTLLNAFNSGDSTQAQVTTAFNKMQSAEAAAAAAGVPVAGSIQAINEAAAAAVDGLGALVSSQQIQQDQTVAQGDKLSTLSSSVIVAAQKLDLLRQQQDTLSASVKAGTAQQSELNDIQTKASAAADDLQKKTFALQQAQLAQGNEAAAAGGQEGVLTQALNEANLGLDQTKTKFDAGAISATAYAGAVKSVVTAKVNLAVQEAEDAADVNRSTDSANLAAAAYAGAAAKLNVLTQAFRNNQASAQDVASAQKSALTAAIDFAQQQAVLQSGLQGATDAMSLQAVAVAEAKAKYDTLYAAVQAGQPVQDQLASALADLKTKQDALNSSIDASSPLIVTQSSNLQNLLVPALGATTTAASAAASAIQQVGTAAAATGGIVAAMAADMKALTDAFGATGSGGGGGPAPAGYQWQFSGQPGITQQTANLIPSPAATPNEIAAHMGITPGQVMQTYGLPDNSAYYDTPIIQIAALIQAAAGAGAGSSGNLRLAPGTTLPTSTGGSTSTGASGGSAQTLAAALQALQFADAGLNAAEASGNAALIQAAQDAVAAANQAYINAGGVGSAAGSTSGTTASTPVASSTSGGGSSAVDGGSYPPVTAHQASGEIWAVQVASGAVSGGGGSTTTGALVQSVSSTVNQTITSGTGSLDGVTQAVGGLVQVLGTVSQGVAAVAQAVASKAVAGSIQILSPTGAAGLPATSTASGSGYSTGPVFGSTASPTTGAGAYTPTQNAIEALIEAQYVSQGLYGQQNLGSSQANPFTGQLQNPLIPVSPYVPSPPSGGAAGGGLNANVTVNMQNANFGGNTPAQIQQAVTAAVTTQLVASLRAAGARF